MSLEKKFYSPKSIREHFSNEVHQWTRVFDDYMKNRKMNADESGYCSCIKMERYYGVNMSDIKNKYANRIKSKLEND